ncbi:MAG: aldehyde dehydrogenase family protein [Candidatus Omnitrophota bacterium]|nr:aldehyde dehydrogenase family protein [Candidatus Omnitrophota bacterium]MDZ4241626.1 aldehyde dehydrogenase family protein [Candidatus Omnitrophota bacterium]
MATTGLKIPQFDLWLGGRFAPAAGGRYFESVNPSTGDVFAKVADASVDDMRQASVSAKKAFVSGGWPGLSVKDRGHVLLRIAQLVRDHAKELADLECLDTGKTIKQTTFIDVPTCADTFEYFGKAGGLLKRVVNPVPAPVTSLTDREPVGVAACIIPWNYPLIMAAWKVAPALIAGNAVILKPSSQASVSLMRLAQIIADAGLPEGIFQMISSARHEATAELVASPDVAMVSFTGGTDTGREIMRLASGLPKKICLELGGKSASLVLEDCDFEAAVGGTLSSIFMNQGQMCTAMSRLLLQDTIYDRFLDALVKKARQLKVGPATDYQTDFGPLVSRSHRDKVLACVETGKAEGAKLLCGGRIPEMPPETANGAYLEPAIFAGVKNAMAIAREEIFGPVLSVIKFSDVEEAVAAANDSRYGLAGCVWTKDPAKAERIASHLQCGTVWVNTYGGFYNEASFGGYKESGFGRELGLEGLWEYTQSKHICVDNTPGGKSLVTSWF